LFCGEDVHRLHGQEAVGLAQPFPQLDDGFVRFLLGCTVDPVNPGFKVGRPAIEQVLVGINADMRAMPENTTSDTYTLTTCE